MILLMSSNLIEKNHPTEDNSVSFRADNTSSCETACLVAEAGFEPAISWLMRPDG
jgi:hypothetical protein